MKKIQYGLDFYDEEIELKRLLQTAILFLKKVTQRFQKKIYSPTKAKCIVTINFLHIKSVQKNNIKNNRMRISFYSKNAS